MAHIILHIMTDIKNPKSRTTSKNVVASQLLPPIGVFWDIENIQVPKGKSASALVNSIRERFFRNHREAEFMCVCDINKESKSIIQDLNNAQVTVVHVDATSKNAADEKLRQCMRRFVDTHGTPASLLLISDDVNFATDLSDFRHRHHIRIMLLHRNHAPEPLLTCAHEHHNFSELTADLPWRSPQKTSSRPLHLIVTDLPSNITISNIRKNLSRLSNNCGGKVLCVTKNKAVISFANPDAAERAQKRMDNHLLCGQKLSVNFLHPDSNDFKEFVVRRRLFKEGNSHAGVSCSSGSSRDSSPHRELNHCYESTDMEQLAKGFAFPAPPVLSPHNLPSFLKSPAKKVASDKNVNSCSSSSTENDKSVAAATMPIHQSNGSHCDKNNITHPSSKESSLDLPIFIKHDGHIQVQGSLPVVDVLDIPPAVCKNSSTRVGLGVNFNNCLEKGETFPSHLYQNNSAEAMSSLTKTMPTQEFTSHVELFVSNLDQSIEVNDMKRILLCLFQEHVLVIHISMLLQPDGNPKAVVRVPSLQDAQYAISQLQRRKIGHKRILISHVLNGRSPPFSVLKSEVIALLKDIPSKRLPVFSFREVYERRYGRAISVSEIYKMWDAVSVSEDANGRMVSLNANYRSSSSPSDSESGTSQELVALEKPYCELHFHPSESEGWAEQQGMMPLPYVFISLKVLSPAVHTLLEKHQGSLPLNSFCACYEADIGPLPIVSSSDDIDELATGRSSEQSAKGAECRPSSRALVPGVPLEHLITCVTGVEIIKSQFCLKKVQWCGNKPLSQPIIRSISPALAGPLFTFGREVTDMLKNIPHCIVLFNKFIPAYHNHFGRQCRVADYGFTKLIDLLEAIPHIIQVLGEGQNRLVTLTHRMQVKRFAADVLRILKSRACKCMTLLEFPKLYEQGLEKPFEILNYGVCDVLDLLAEVTESTIVVTNTGEDAVISIPKREQTKEEVERTRIFSNEVIELLKHTPAASMAFDKFIPAYHHHFGKQCRVADFGFSKLIELFEAIPIIKITGCGEDKVIHLEERIRDGILVDKLSAVLKAQANNIIALHLLGSAYTAMHGHALKPQDFGATNIPDLLRKIAAPIKVVEGFADPVVVLINKEFVEEVSLRIRCILMAEKDGQMAISKLNQIYQKRYGHNIQIDAFTEELANFIKVESGVVKLVPLQVCARDMVIAIQDAKAPLSLPEFESEFVKMFGTPIKPSAYGFSGLPAMLQSLNEYFILSKKKKKWSVQLNKKKCSTLITVKRKLASSNASEEMPSTTIQGPFNSPSSARNQDCTTLRTPPSINMAAAAVVNQGTRVAPLNHLPHTSSPIRPDIHTIPMLNHLGLLNPYNSLVHYQGSMPYVYSSPPALQHPLFLNPALYLPQSVTLSQETSVVTTNASTSYSSLHRMMSVSGHHRGTSSEPQTPVRHPGSGRESHTRSSTPIRPQSRDGSQSSGSRRRSRIAANFSNPIDF